jgi:hypothetical protein
VYSSPGSRLQIRITPRIFKKKFEFVSGHACLLRPGKVVDEKKTGVEKSRDTVPLTVNFKVNGTIEFIENMNSPSPDFCFSKVVSLEGLSN